MICMFSAAGELEHALARGDFPAWSPDGFRIAFEGADSSIHTIAPDGTDERDLSPSPSAGPREHWPVWSPDSEELAFFIHAPDEPDIFIQELWVMDALGGNRRRLVPQVNSWVREVAWSRDGERLAFRLPSGELAVIQRGGTGLTTVSPIGGQVSSWDWRP
jgi:Tol biopolymer transport system component